MYCDYNDDSDLDEDWFYNSIQRYDDLLIYDFQGKVSSACFLTEEKLIATCCNTSTNGGNEILELTLPERLLATKDCGLYKNRDFSISSAGYLRSSATCVIAEQNRLITAEDEGVHVYTIPDPKESDLIKHKLKIRDIGNLQISICANDRERLFSGSHLNNIQSHSLGCGNEIGDRSELQLNNIFENEAENLTLAYIESCSNEIIIGLRDVNFLISLDPRTRKAHRTVRPHSADNRVKKWSYRIHSSGKTAVLNCSGELFICDTRNSSKEVSKIMVDFKVLEDQGNRINIQFDPSGSFLSVSGFDKLVKVYSLKSAIVDECPRFVHDGHTKSINFIHGHLWHPSLTNTVFSFDDRGTLTAWKFK